MIKPQPKTYESILLKAIAITILFIGVILLMIHDLQTTEIGSFKY